MWQRGPMCKFESKEVCESLCFHSKSVCTGSAAWHAGQSFSLIFFVCVVTLGEARHDCFSQCHAGANVV